MVMPAQNALQWKLAPWAGQALASIEDQAVIDKILAHLIKKGALPPAPELLPAARASPGSDWFT